MIGPLDLDALDEAVATCTVVVEDVEAWEDRNLVLHHLNPEVVRALISAARQKDKLLAEAKEARADLAKFALRSGNPPEQNGPYAAIRSAWMGLQLAIKDCESDT